MFRSKAKTVTDAKVSYCQVQSQKSMCYDQEIKLKFTIMFVNGEWGVWMYLENLGIYIFF
jgi:hypothetical protein